MAEASKNGGTSSSAGNCVGFACARQSKRVIEGGVDTYDLVASHHAHLLRSLHRLRALCHLPPTKCSTTNRNTSA